MSLTFTVGGARGTFEERFAAEVAEVLDHAFGAEGDWEVGTPQSFGDLAGTGWAAFQARAVAALGADALPNLLALGQEGRGVYLPAHVRAISLPLSAGAPLRCASLPALRLELAELAQHWGLSLEDEGLSELLTAHHDPEVLTFARLALAVNEALRRDCPLWLVG